MPAGDRPERVEPDVQRDARPVDAPGREGREQVLSEVKTRRRRGRGAALPCKHGLIPVEITLCFLTAADVARRSRACCAISSGGSS